MRHWCEQGDNLDSFGWKQHDGRNFGIQKLIDRGVQVSRNLVVERKSRKFWRVYRLKIRPIFLPYQFLKNQPLLMLQAK